MDNPDTFTHEIDPDPDSIGLPPAMNGTFDAAFTIFVVHEVPDPAKLFREIPLLLRPGGTLFFTEPPFVVSGTSSGRALLLWRRRDSFRLNGRFSS